MRDARPSTVVRIVSEPRSWLRFRVPMPQRYSPITDSSPVDPHTATPPLNGELNDGVSK